MISVPAAPLSLNEPLSRIVRPPVRMEMARASI
jgi:hypothetical protein